MHLAPHATVDRHALGADLLVCSPYKFFGPHLGALAADPELLERLHPDKLLPSTDAVPERLELGTLPYELLAGVAAAVDFMADLEPGESATTAGRRGRLVASMAAVEEHEAALLDRLLSGLAAIEGVTLHGAPARRTPTVMFSVGAARPSRSRSTWPPLDVHAPAGSFYALEAARHLGLGDAGAVRVGLAAYTSESDVDRLLSGVAAL